MRAFFLIHSCLLIGRSAVRDRIVRLRRGAAQPPVMLPGQVRCASAGRCGWAVRVPRTGWGD